MDAGPKIEYQMRFSDIVGHNETVSALREMADSSRVPHALLLSGMTGIGKTRLARAFAQYIHCQNKTDGDSCGKCPSCVQHQTLNNPDMHFVYPIVKITGNKVTLCSDWSTQWREMLDKWSYMPPERWNEIMNVGTSQPRIFVTESEEIISKATLSTYKEKQKIFLIWLPEAMQPETANKLLKIIEEPFPDTVFILVSNNDSAILPTITSRTRRINMKPLHEDEIRDWLVSGRGLDPRQAADVARRAGGSISKAEQIACHPDELNEFASVFQALMRSAYGARMQTLKQISEDTASYGRRKLIRFLEYCNSQVRENFIYNLRMPQLLSLSGEEEAFSRRFAPFIHAGNVEDMTDTFSIAARDIERNCNSKVVMYDVALLMATLLRRKHPAP